MVSVPGSSGSVPPVGHHIMAPPPPRPQPVLVSRKPLVLEEDEWAEALESIIERDFFPDIPKMQSKLEWLQVQHSPQVCCCVSWASVDS